jgi:mannose-6-phosphate isomerase-like protein (cupin superfamily)
MPLRGPVAVVHQTRENSEKVQVGPTTIYIFEDGTNTDNRIGCMLLELPAGASGPPMHWHRFHDECFFVTKGRVTFVTPDADVVVGVGELYVLYLCLSLFLFPFRSLMNTSPTTTATATIKSSRAGKSWWCCELQG